MANEKTPEIKKTYDYKKFSFLPENRPINKWKVAQIAESIKRDDQTPWRPVLVNKKLGIIDGQHQFKAEEKLGYPVYYVVNPDATVKAIALLNAYTTTWGYANFMYFYAKQGIESYVQCEKFAKKYHLSPSLAIGMLTMTFHSMGKLRSSFKEGTFVITHFEEANILMDEVSKLRPYILDETLGSREFYHAYTLMRQQVELDYFIQKLTESNKKIELKGRKKEYMREFEDIINWRKQTNLTRLY